MKRIIYHAAVTDRSCGFLGLQGGIIEGRFLTRSSFLTLRAVPAQFMSYSHHDLQVIHKSRNIKTFEILVKNLCC